MITSKFKKAIVILFGMGVGMPIIAWQYESWSDPAEACAGAKHGLVEETDLFGYVEAKGYCANGMKIGTWLETNRFGDLYRLEYESGVHTSKQPVARTTRKIAVPTAFASER